MTSDIFGTKSLRIPVAFGNDLAMSVLVEISDHNTVYNTFIWAILYVALNVATFDCIEENSGSS